MLQHLSPPTTIKIMGTISIIKGVKAPLQMP